MRPQQYNTMNVILIILAMACIASFIVWFFSPTPAKSQELGEWLQRSWRHHHHHPRYQRLPRRVYPRVEELEEGRRCLGRVVSDKGREFTSTETALKDAERSWSALVREEPGEKWMDLKFARRYETRCQQSSTGESTTAKITETLTGGALGTLYRCRVWAEPCTAPKTNDGRD